MFPLLCRSFTYDSPPIRFCLCCLSFGDLITSILGNTSALMWLLCFSPEVSPFPVLPFGLYQFPWIHFLMYILENTAQWWALPPPSSCESQSTGDARAKGSLLSTKMPLRGRIERSLMGKSMGHSSRGPGFGFQHHIVAPAAYNSSSRDSDFSG